jgi:uncharacterized protein (DUF924 family)
MARKTFTNWLNDVDGHITRLCDMNIDDLPDFAYREAYENGATALQTARAAVRTAHDC